MIRRASKLMAAAFVTMLILGYASSAGAVTCPVGKTCTTYDLTLTPLPHLGSTGGTATLILDGVSGHDVLSLDVIMNLPNGKDFTFDFGGASLHNATADVVGGIVTSLDALDILLFKGSLLFSNQGVIFLDFKNPRFDSIDSVFGKAATTSGSPGDPSPTPAPATWTVMLLGLTLLGWLAWRRRRAVAVA